jgi:porphobilinogen synthase
MQASFPQIRMRRLRRHDWARRLVAETRLSAADLIWPVFLVEGENRREPIAAMPGIERLSVDQAVRAVDEAVALGISAVALFPHTDPALKTPDGSEALNPSNLVCRAVRAIKRSVQEIGVLCDVALDPYTTHGHDGVLIGEQIANDETVDILARQAVLQAEAGCDIVAPSDMMDGRVAAIRAALEANGFTNTLIMAYAAKYASAFYGPFRDAIGSAKALTGDKRSYQMDPANSYEALREVALDIAEGADMVMIKPGLPYLDVLYRVKERFGMPTFAYQVSGEYAMLVAAAERGFIERERAILESLLAFRRAGASGIFTYFALEAARLLNQARHR